MVFDESWDRFSIAVIFYEILFNIHPYAATFSGQYQSFNAISEKIRNNLFVHGTNAKNNINFLPPPHNNFLKVPPELQNLFLNAFQTNPLLRPNSSDFGKIFYKIVTDVEPISRQTVFSVGFTNSLPLPPNPSPSLPIIIPSISISKKTAPSSSVFVITLVLLLIFTGVSAYFSYSKYEQFSNDLIDNKIKSISEEQRFLIEKYIADKKAKEKQERLAKEAEDKRREQEHLAKEAEDKRREQERLAKEAEDKRREQERLAKEAEDKRREQERLAKEAEDKRKEQERLTKEAEDKKRKEQEQLSKNYPKESCGETTSKKAHKDMWYSVYVSASVGIDQARNYCKDAKKVPSPILNTDVIQLASFLDINQAKAFAKEVGNGAEVGGVLPEIKRHTDNLINNPSATGDFERKIASRLPTKEHKDRKKARPLNDEGLSYFNQGKYTAAIDSFLDAYKNDPADAEVVGNLGFAYYMSNDFGNAEKNTLLSIRLKPDRIASWKMLGAIYAQKGETQKAENCFVIGYNFSKEKDKFLEKLRKPHSSQDTPEIRKAINGAIKKIENR